MDVVANPAVQLITPTNTTSRASDEEEHQEAAGEKVATSADYEDADLRRPDGVDAGRPELSFEEMAAVPEDGVAALEDEFPGDRGALAAWVVLTGAFLALFPSFGFMVSIGTLQDYWHTHQLADYTPRDVGWIPSVFVYLALGLGIWVGPLFDRYGPRWILLIGSTSYIVMIFLLAQCTLYWHFLLCIGFLGGVSGATLTTTSLAVVSHWFKKKRGLAAGIAMIGSSFGGLVIPLILRATLPRYGYQWSIRILGFVFTGCLILGNTLMRPRLAPSPTALKQSIISLSIYGDLRFSLLTISVFGLEIVLFGALGILPTYASLGTDFPPDTSFYVISVMNGVSCIGRLLPGYLSDIIGRFNVLLIMIFTTLIFTVAIWLPFGHTSLAGLYVFVSLFGFGTGAWMALTPACIGQLCEADQFGRYYGTLYFIASLATLVCIPISGELVASVGPQVMVGFMCAILGLSMFTFILSRWACQGWKWKWIDKL